MLVRDERQGALCAVACGQCGASVLAAKPYKYEADWVPHDARVKEYGTGRTRVETMQSFGLRPIVVPNHKIDDGINAARVTFARCRFDEGKCRQGIEALRQYRADYDDKTRAFRNAPKHDWTSHSADGVRYLCMAWRELEPPEPEKPKLGLHEATLDDLWELAGPKTSRGRI